MKRITILCLLLVLTGSAASVDDNDVMYSGGTVPGLTPGLVGRLDTTSEAALIFNYSGGRMAISYADIRSFQYSEQVARHLGVLPAIAVGLLKMRQHRHFFRISYDDNSVPQVVIFEVPKSMPRTLQAVLETRVSKCKLHSCRAGQN